MQMSIVFKKRQYPPAKYQVPEAGSQKARSSFLVHRLLARRTRLPPTVHPQPLLGIASDISLNHLIKGRRVRQDIGLAVAGGDQLQRRIESDSVLPQVLVPYGKRGHHGGAG